MSFEERYEDMGLKNIDNICYYYSDRYGELIYRKLETKDHSEIGGNCLVPYLALFTKRTDQDEFRYCGIVSNSYKFVGNDKINNQIRESIREIGMPILKEDCLLDSRLTSMCNEIIIEHATNVPQEGDVYPQIIIKNSYNGTCSTNIAFGIRVNNCGFGFKHKIGDINQIHLSSSMTTLHTAVGKYIEAFSSNITEMIQSSFNHMLSEDDTLLVLDLIENVGKKRRNSISSILKESLKDSQSPEISAWKMFLAIVRFSSIEKNLNAKSMMESIAERCLTVPAQMINMIETMNH